MGGRNIKMERDRGKGIVMECDKCEVHDKTMDRLFTGITDIKIQVSEIATRQEEIIDFKNIVREVIYGNGSPGMKERLTSATKQLWLQWGILLIILTAIIGVQIIAK